MLSQDEAHWGKNLELTIRDAEELQDKIAGMFEKFQKSLSETLNVKRVPKPAKQLKYSLKKLPMWGDVYDLKEVDFEWPTRN